MTVLKEKMTTGLIWSTLDRFLTFLIQFILGIILARILMPEDYGLIGMIAIFIAISQSVVDSGFFTALVQKRDVNQTDYSTIFFFNIVVGVVLYLLLFLSADFIADFYEIAVLSDLTKVVGINILIVSTTIVHKAFITTKIDFKTLAVINIVSALIGGLVGLYFALNNHGVWSLVYQSLTKSTVMAILYWVLNNWKPTFLFNKQSFRALFGFGSKLMLSELLKIFFKNIYLIIIGKVYQAEELGYFTRATLFKQIPSTLVNTILQSVTFPVLVKVIDEDTKVKKLLERSVRLTGFLLFPVTFVLVFFAKAIIVTLLTTKWLPSVILLQILAFEIIFHPLQYINLNFLNAKGRSDLFLKLEFIKNTLVIIAIISTYQYGLVWMCIGYVVVSFVGFFINTYYTQKFINYSAFHQLKDLLPYIGVSLFSVFISYIICSALSNNLLQLIFGVLLATGFYFSLSYFLKFKELIELQGLIVNKIKSNKS